MNEKRLSGTLSNYGFGVSPLCGPPGGFVLLTRGRVRVGHIPKPKWRWALAEIKRQRMTYDDAANFIVKDVFGVDPSVANKPWEAGQYGKNAKVMEPDSPPAPPPPLTTSPSATDNSPLTPEVERVAPAQTIADPPPDIEDGWGDPLDDD